MPLEVKTFPPVRLAYMRYTGPYGHPHIAMHWQRFGAWCEQQGLMQPRRKMYGISLDNPMLTPPADCRYDLAIEVDDNFKLPEPDGSGVGLQQYEGGRYACTVFTGTALQIGPAWMAVFGQALPMSGLQREEKPATEVYLEDFKLDPKTFAFRDHVQNAEYKHRINEYVPPDDISPRIALSKCPVGAFFTRFTALWLFTDALTPAPSA